MARNVEIKARLGGLADLAAVVERARVQADAPVQVLNQDDTFFACAHGRLKLREFDDGSAELIHYQRADGKEARLSDYVRCVVTEPSALREALTRAHGVLGRVQKRRQLLIVGATRIHLDEVVDLGLFIELEVVLTEQQTLTDGQAIAEALMATLGLADAPRVAVAYLDLLAARPLEQGQRFLPP